MHVIDSATSVAKWSMTFIVIIIIIIIIIILDLSKYNTKEVRTCWFIAIVIVIVLIQLLCLTVVTIKECLVFASYWNMFPHLAMHLVTVSQSAYLLLFYLIVQWTAHNRLLLKH